MASKKPQADAELEELDVREVSIVDRPANKRKFLIIKRDVAGLDLEEDMPDTRVTKDDDTSLLDLLGLELGDDDSDFDHRDGIVTLDDDFDLEAITKAAIEETNRIVSAMVGRLSKVVSALKGGGGGGDDKDAEKAEVPPKVAGEIKSIAKTLATLAQKLSGQGGEPGGEPDGEKEAAKKADSAAVLKVCSAALQKLMSAAGKLKAIDKGAEEVPTAIVADIGAVAVALGKAVELPADDGDKGADDKVDDADKKKTTKRAEPFQVFVTKGTDDDPEIIIKAGAKMKKARLNQFKKAVETLMSLLKELEGDQGGDKDAKDKKGVQKSDTSDLNEKLVKGFELLQSKLGDMIAGTMKTALEPITKRLDEIEETVPPGNGDADVTEVKTEEVKKSDEGLWSNLFR